MDAASVRELLGSYLTSTWGQVLFVGVIPLIALGFAIYSIRITRHARSRSSISYHATHRRLLGYPKQLLPADIEIKFRDQPVRRLDKSAFLFWNSGNQTISGENIVGDDHFRITGDFANLLDAQVVKRTRDTNRVAVQLQRDNKKDVLISFHYLEPNDGAIVEVFYERGGDDSSSRPQLLGTIKGMSSGVIDVGIRPPLKWGSRIPLIVIAVLGAVTFLRPSLAFWQPEIGSALRVSLEIVSRLIGGIFLAGGIALLWIFRRHYPKSLITDDFRQ